MSENCGTERPLQSFIFAPEGGGGGSGCPLCARLRGLLGVAKRINSRSRRSHDRFNRIDLLEQGTTNDLLMLESISLPNLRTSLVHNFNATSGAFGLKDS